MPQSVFDQSSGINAEYGESRVIPRLQSPSMSLKLKEKEKEVTKWKKSKEITGVSVGSMVDFKAIVAQEKAEISSGKTKSKVRRVEGQIDVKNKGVASRAMKDKAEAEREDALKSLHVVEQRLAEKVTMYNDFVQGKSLDVAELNKGGYLVDFEQKRWDQPANEPELIHPDMYLLQGIFLNAKQQTNIKRRMR
eukprot:TRINITY_DN7282_c0_g1_i4.p1 TRINITY_DN7282_c0_g1~~TRINITY_DN7282_c0_g1_i4.p1  ORF type:complete len:193 (-),score=55.00 TRINITY_DN7282_c0_g1_i4:529-1107(-)